MHGTMNINYLVHIFTIMKEMMKAKFHKDANF